MPVDIEVVGSKISECLFSGVLQTTIMNKNTYVQYSARIAGSFWHLSLGLVNEKQDVSLEMDRVEPQRPPVKVTESSSEVDSVLLIVSSNRSNSTLSWVELKSELFDAVRIYQE